MDFTKIVRSHIVNLSPYSSARDEYSGAEGVFLDANENPFSSVTKEALNRYPDPYQSSIKQKLAKLKGCKPENIFLGNGSDEPIDLLIRLVCEPLNSNIVIMPPTYGMYKVCADISQVIIQNAPLTEDFQIDLDNVFDAVNIETKIIWICSPNNPSGNLLEEFSIEQILKAFPNKIVAIDEAYIDFTNQASFIYKLEQYPNLVVLQTFSKAWGMAGLRIGTAYAHPELIRYMNKIKYPYNINILTQVKVLESLDKVSEKDSLVAKIIENRTLLINGLEKLQSVLKIHPSDSNMVLVKFKDSEKTFQSLLSKKVILRDRSKVALCEGCIRISVGTEEEIKILLTELEKLES
ncbi:MAG: histidinol-phosphate transaminase [Leadbetterella sp.]